MQMSRETGRSIVADFYIQEIKRILVCGFGLLLLMGYLAYVTLRLYWLLVPAAVVVFALARMALVGLRRFGRVFDGLGEFQKERIARDYSTSHPICKVFQGQLHLLPDCIVCRNRGQLWMVMLSQIETIRQFTPRKTYWTVSTLELQTDSAEKYQIEFFGNHKKEVKQVISWMQEQNSRIGIVS